MKHYPNRATAHYKQDGPWSLSDPSFNHLTACPERRDGRILRHKVFRRFRDEYEPDSGLPAYIVSDAGPIQGKIVITTDGPEFERYHA